MTFARIRDEFRPVFAARGFRLLFLASLGSGVGTWMATVALTLDVQRRTHSAWWVSALLIVSFLPAIVVGLTAGPLIDRLSRKRLTVGADVVRFGAFAALPFVTAPLSIVVLAALVGAANSVFRPAVLAGVPNLVPQNELARATSLLQATEWAATALGPVVGGALVSASGTHLVYWLNAFTFLFSALLILQIPARSLQSEQGVTRGHWRDLGDGFAAFRRSRALWTVLIAFGFAQLQTGFINVSEVFLATRALHSGAFGYGLLWTATGIGLVAGSLLTSIVADNHDLADAYPYVFLPWAAGTLGAAVAPNIWLATAGMVVSGFGNGIAFPMTVLIVQRWTHDRVRGRAFTLIMSVHFALLGAAMVAAGALTEAVGPRWVYVAGAAALVAAASSAFALSRGIRWEPAVARRQAA